MDENELVPLTRDGAPVAGGSDANDLVPHIRNGVPVVADRDEGPMAPRVAGWQPMDQEMSDAIASRGAVGQFLNTFGQGAAKGWGTDFVDKWMQDTKLVRGTEPGDFDGVKSVFKAFNEVFPRTIAKAIEYPIRGLNALIHGAGDAITEAGGGRSSFAGEMVQVAEMVLTAGKGGPTGGAGMPERAMQAARPKSLLTKVEEQALAEAKSIEKNIAEGTVPDWYLKGDPKRTEIWNVEKEAELAARGEQLAEVQPRLLKEAEDLGLIGPKKPDFATATPNEISALVRGARQEDFALAKQAENAGDVVKSDVVAPQKTAWRERFDKFVDRLNTSDDVAALIRASATENGEFVAARNGPLPTSRVEMLSDATGIPARDLDLNTVGQRIPSDVEMAAAMDMTVRVTDRAQEMMRAVNQTGGDAASLIELQIALMRRDLVVEHVVGLRAEWNRTGMVLQGKDAARPGVASKAKTALGEFLDLVKDEATLKEWLDKNKGRSIDDLKELAKRGENLDRAQLAKLLQNARKPNFAENMHRYWVSAILSGIYGHGAFFFADAAYMALKYAVVTPVSGVSGAVRQLLAGDKAIERVYAGEGFARGQGVIEAIPDAFMGMWETFKSGDVMLLPREITKGEQGGAVNLATGHATGGNSPGNVIMTAGQRALAMQQSFFKILADRAEVHSLAYRETAKEGFSPALPDFWKRKHEHMVTPKEEWLDAGVKHAEFMTWINDMGAAGEGFDKWRRNSFGKWIVPFFRTPGNQANAARELIPGVNLTSKATRNELKGGAGGVAQDTQIANMIVGGMLLGYGAYLALGDRLTDGGPVDPQENALWKIDHMPNAIRIGDQWVPLQKFGPLAVHLGMAATAARAGKNLSEAEYGELAQTLVKGIGNVVLNATGMKGVSDMLRAQANPERYGEQYVANFAAGFLPLSTFMGQTASMLDPYQREVKTVLDALKNKTPYLRETLFPVRDWSGVPVANDRAGLKAFLAMRPVNFDPVDREMQALQISPTKAEPRIGNVRLTREQYDELQNAGAVQTRQGLQALVDMPSWYNLPEYSREKMFRSTISAARENARTYVKMKYWGTEDDVLIKEMQDKVNHVTGQPRQFNKKANPLTLDQP